MRVDNRIPEAHKPWYSAPILFYIRLLTPVQLIPIPLALVWLSIGKADRRCFLHCLLVVCDQSGGGFHVTSNSQNRV
jgi:hypothetical protein